MKVHCVDAHSEVTLAVICHSESLPADFTEEAHLLEGFEAATLRRGYLVRLVSLVTRLCRRTHHVVGSRMQSAQVSCSCTLKELFDILGNVSCRVR